MKNMFLFMVMVCILFTFQPDVFAIDTDACDNFPHNWGNNECVGLLEYNDMFQKLDGNHIWYSPDHYANLSSCTDVFSPCPSMEEMLPRVKDAYLEWSVLRNRSAPAGVYPSMANGPDSSLMFNGYLSGLSIPYIWLMKIDTDGDGTMETQGYHIDWLLHPSCEEFCHEWGCGFDACDENGCPILTASDGTQCGWDERVNMFAGPMFRSVSTSVVKKEHVASITWLTGPNGPETTTVKESPTEIYNFMKYDNRQNIIQTVDPWRGGVTNYTHGFSVIAPVGTHQYIIKLTTGEELNFTAQVESNRDMPVVPSTYTTTQSVAVPKKAKKDDDEDDDRKRKRRKSGKRVKATEVEVVVDNITAREITDEDGQIRLLIQWAEPDLAMTFSEYMKDVRLRVYVGDGWMGAPIVNGQELAHFLWIDAPVHSGSLVIPPAEYAELKAKVNGPIYVSGQYREQYETFHNRGYWGYITLPQGLSVRFNKYLADRGTSLYPKNQSEVPHWENKG